MVQKATGSYCTYLIPGKTAALVPEFAVEEMSRTEHVEEMEELSKTTALVPEFVVEELSRTEHVEEMEELSKTAALVPEFAVKDLPLLLLLGFTTLLTS